MSEGFRAGVDPVNRFRKQVIDGRDERKTGTGAAGQPIHLAHRRQKLGAISALLNKSAFGKLF